jgi:DNA-binding transcriptional LysR family regulator
MTHFGLDSWSFPAVEGSTVPRSVQFTPRFVVDSARAALASAVEGHGVTRLFSYQLAEYLRDGRLQIVLRADEYPLRRSVSSCPHGRLYIPKVRAFVDFVVPRLRTQFARLAEDAGT